MTTVGRPSKERAVKSHRKQARSRHTKTAILESAIRLIAAKGVQSITHRAVAAEADISISKTTYHFSSKSDIVQQAYKAIIDQNSAFLEQSYGELLKAGPVTPDVLAAYLTVVTTLQTTDSRYSRIAWVEIMLEAARQKTMRRFAAQWYSNSAKFWKGTTAFATAYDSDQVSKTLLTYLVGKYLYLIAQGTPMTQIAHLRFSLSALVGLLAGEQFQPSPFASLEEVARTASAPKNVTTTDRLRQKRGEKTEADIVDAAVAIVGRGGNHTLTLRGVAKKAAVSLAATSYHFESRDDLLQQAYQRIHLLEAERDRAAMDTLDLRTATKDDVVSFICDYLQQEATASRDHALAHREFLLETGRHAVLRDLTRQLLADRQNFWMKLLTHLKCDDPYIGADILLGFLAGRVLLMLGVGDDLLDPNLCERDVRFVIDLLV